MLSTVRLHCPYRYQFLKLVDFLWALALDTTLEMAMDFSGWAGRLEFLLSEERLKRNCLSIKTRMIRIPMFLQELRTWFPNSRRTTPAISSKIFQVDISRMIWILRI